MSLNTCSLIDGQVWEPPHWVQPVVPVELPAVIELAEKLADEEIKPEEPIPVVKFWLGRLLRDAWGVDVCEKAPEALWANEATYDKVKSRLAEAMMQYAPVPTTLTTGEWEVLRYDTRVVLRRLPDGKSPNEFAKPTVNIVPVYWAVTAILDQLKVLLEENEKAREDNLDTFTRFIVEDDTALDKLVDFCLACSIRNAFEVDIDPPYYEPDGAQYILANALYDSVGDEVDRYITQFDNLRWKKMGAVIGDIPLAYTYFRKGNSVYLVSPKDET